MLNAVDLIHLSSPVTVGVFHETNLCYNNDDNNDYDN